MVGLPVQGTSLPVFCQQNVGTSRERLVQVLIQDLKGNSSLMKLFVGTLEKIQSDEPDILLREQYNELRQRRHELGGELGLMFAVLEDAIHCYLRHMNANGRQHRKLFYEVRHWMNSRHQQGLFTFETLCDALGIDAGRLRRLLERQRRRVTDCRRSASRQRMWVTPSRPRSGRVGT